MVAWHRQTNSQMHTFFDFHGFSLMGHGQNVSQSEQQNMWHISGSHPGGFNVNAWTVLPLGAPLYSHSIKPAPYWINGCDWPNPFHVCWSSVWNGGGNFFIIECFFCIFS